MSGVLRWPTPALEDAACRVVLGAQNAAEVAALARAAAAAGRQRRRATLYLSCRRARTLPISTWRQTGRRAQRRRFPGRHYTGVMQTKYNLVQCESYCPW